MSPLEELWKASTATVAPGQRGPLAIGEQDLELRLVARPLGGRHLKFEEPTEVLVGAVLGPLQIPIDRLLVVVLFNRVGRVRGCDEDDDQGNHHVKREGAGDQVWPDGALLHDPPPVPEGPRIR